MKPELFQYFLVGSLGIVLQILAKISDLQKKSKVANHAFELKGYFIDDWTTILSSFISVFIAIACIDELLAAKPELANYIKWFFVFVGYTGSTIIQSLLGVTNKKIMAIIDIKTNVADGITPAVDATNKEGVEEIIKDDSLTK